MSNGSRTARVITSVVLVASAATAGAQRPVGADTLSAKAVAESVVVMRRLENSARATPNDAALWYRIGMIAWALYDRDRNGPPVEGIDWTLLGRRADTSFRLAKQLEPRNPRYTLTAGQFFLGTGLVTMREQSYGMFGEALAIARANNDPLVHAESAIEVGRVYWRRYDAVANGGALGPDASDVRLLAAVLAKDTATQRKSGDPERASKTRPYTRPAIARARQALDRNAKAAPARFAGESDYMLADQYLHEAYDALPALPRAFSQLAMLFAERARWAELQDLADDQTKLAPRNPWGWMSLGLATYRIGNAHGARIAFANGLKLMSADERERLDRIERIVTRTDSVGRAALSAGERNAHTARYWLAADPLWSRDDLDPRVEFLSRVTFAELRWTVEELVKRGADTDRGNIHVRYGPPDRVATRAEGISWTYDYAGLGFRFHGAPAFGTASFSDFGRALSAIDSIPVRWDNLPVMRIDSIPAQAARFRATATEMDVFFAGVIPAADITRGSDLAAAARADLWIVDSTGAPVIRDSSRVSAGGTQTRIQRIPYGAYTYRLEATADASLVAARSSGPVGITSAAEPAVGAQGFGISDVVFATRVAAQAGSARRWNEYEVTPLSGSVARGSDLSLLWENYDFGSQGGAASYAVTVSIKRERTRVGRIAARILGNIAGVVGRNVGNDRLDLQFDRSNAHAAEFADNVAINLGPTPAGSYFVTVSVMDKVSGNTAARTMRLVIVE